MLYKIKDYSKGCVRAFPIIIIIVSLFTYIVFQIKFALYFTIYMLIVDVLSHILKQIFANYKIIPFNTIISQS